MPDTQSFFPLFTNKPFRLVAIILGATLLVNGCATAPKKPASDIVTPAIVKPSDKPPFTAFLDGVFPWGPSKTFSQTQRAFSRLCKQGELPDRDSASKAVDLFEKALRQPDLEAQERTALEQHLANSREAYRFYDLAVTNYERFGPGIESSDPYKQEEALKGYIKTYRSEATSFTRDGYRAAVNKHILDVEPRLNALARKIRNLEREYSDDRAQAQNNFIQTSARQDIQQARNHYHAGKGRWFSNDNEWEISKGLSFVQRVVTSPRVHTSLRSEAEVVKRMIWRELGQNDINRAFSSLPPPYEKETNYPGNTESGMRAYVRQQWGRESIAHVEGSLK